ncbi:MAG: hypothetical protein JWL90_3011 [Chthoniobacteraceae bacterium]|nr:hypothetical protein [Chthoniobacteraceae bacterium]
MNGDGQLEPLHEPGELELRAGVAPLRFQFGGRATRETIEHHSTGLHQICEAALLEFFVAVHAEIPSWRKIFKPQRLKRASTMEATKDQQST